MLHHDNSQPLEETSIAQENTDEYVITSRSEQEEDKTQLEKESVEQE